MDKKPKLLIVIGCLDLGGTEKHLLSVLPLLKKYFQVSIYTTSYAGTLAAQFRQAGINVFSQRNQAFSSVHKITKIFYQGGCFIRLFIFFRKVRPDIIHFFLPGAYLLGGTTALIARQKNLIMSRRSQNDYQKKYPLLARFEKKLHPYMKKVVANSSRVKEQLLNEGVKNQQLELLYNGVDLNNYAGIDNSFPINELGIDTNILVLTIVANLYFYKGHADLFKALNRIKDKLPQNWRLLCIGRDEGEGKNLAALADSLNLNGHICFLGEQKEHLPSLLQRTDIGLLTSHEEGFSNAILEMMAAGKPMVVTDVGGNGEAVIDGDCGLVVPAKDPNALAAAILKLALNQKLRVGFGRNARQRVIEKFSLAHCVKQYQDLYKSVLVGS